MVADEGTGGPGRLTDVSPDNTRGRSSSVAVQSQSLFP